MKHFHAHIYFESDQQPEITKLRLLALSDTLFTLNKLHEKPVGPHPKAMLELHFTDVAYERAMAWLKANCFSFSVLIHQDTGDDFKDHTDDIHWLGEVLPINFSFFELIQSHPELRVHP